jgi:hypothetical protein
MAQLGGLDCCGGVLDRHARIRSEFRCCREQIAEANPEQGSAKHQGWLMRVSLRRCNEK